LIVGGGLAGLSAAYHSNGDYLVLERESRVGGLCRTNWYKGFGFDLSIHILFTKRPDLAELICDELLGGRYHDHTRSSWVYSHGVYTGYPFQASLYGLPVGVATECLLGLVEANHAARTEPPANFGEWARGTFGEGIANHFFLPYNEKVWAIPPEQMDFRWIADRVPVPDLEEVIRGSLQAPTVRHGPNASFWYPKEGGIESLSKAFLEQLEPARVQVNTEVAAIDPARREVTTTAGETHAYENLITSLPLPTLVRLTRGAPPEVQRAADQLQSNTVFTVLLGIGRENISSHHWVYCHEDEFLFHRISYPMNFSESLVPAGCSSVMAEISHSSHRDLSGRDLIAETIAGLQRMGVLRPNDEILVSEIVRISPAYVIYTLDHEAAVATILEWLTDQQIHSVGRFGEWAYFNMDDAIASGRDAVRSLQSGGEETIIDLVAAERGLPTAPWRTRRRVGAGGAGKAKRPARP
jgi:UDP-galactopyranose mutase